MAQILKTSDSSQIFLYP
ncbi:MAG: sortase B protein-sorting domain-containing protein [Chroococcus sp. CMT-3BRIN-NPC107]|nr:sortase B protein-sorting domain-containing protein [Chroococcus sp. CMT-3BRIN-NPC107]